MGFFKQKTVNGNLKIKVLHEEGLPNVGKLPVFLILNKESKKITIEINPKLTKGPTELSLDISKIISTQRITEQEIKKRANPTKNAIVGGILFGTAGAVVGSTMNKDKTHTVFYRVIKYATGENKEEKELIFRFAGDFNEDTFFNELNSLINFDSLCSPNETFEL